MDIEDEYVNNKGEFEYLAFKAVKPFVRSPYNYDRDEASKAAGLRIPEDEEDMTQQHFKDETDINVIMDRFGVTGELPNNIRMPQFSDFIETEDYQTSMNAVRQAAESFMKLDPKVRERFGNNPQLFVEFCADEKNYDEAAKMGLVPPTPVPVITDMPEYLGGPPKEEKPPKAAE